MKFVARFIFPQISQKKAECFNHLHNSATSGRTYNPAFTVDKTPVI